MEIININNIHYYFARQIRDVAKKFRKGIRTDHQLIKEKNITDYVYARYNNNNKEWVKSSGISPKVDKILIKKDWADSNVEEIGQNNTISDIATDNKVLPPIIHISESEKFKNETGGICNIEIRGERSVNKCLFKLVDLITVFDLDVNIRNVIIRSDGYRFNEYTDYSLYTPVYINCSAHIKADVYLTFEGLVKLAFTHHSIKLNMFKEWIKESLFIIILGNKIEKQELVSNILGFDSKVVNTLFSKNDKGGPPMIYFITFGYVNELLNDEQKLNNKYTDDHILCKYGFTHNIQERLSDHIRVYKKDINTNIDAKLFCIAIVDELSLYDAENAVEDHFSERHISINGHKELVVTTVKNLKGVKNYFDILQRSYIGSYSKQLEEFNKLKTEITSKDHEIELLGKNHQIELIEKNHQIELMESKMELLELKITHNIK